MNTDRVVFHLNVKTLNPNHLPLTISITGDKTWRDFKEKIVESGGFPGVRVENLRLIFAGLGLDDSRELNTYGSRVP